MVPPLVPTPAPAEISPVAFSDISISISFLFMSLVSTTLDLTSSNSPQGYLSSTPWSKINLYDN